MPNFMVEGLGMLNNCLLQRTHTLFHGKSLQQKLLFAAAKNAKKHEQTVQKIFPNNWAKGSGIL